MNMKHGFALGTHLIEEAEVNSSVQQVIIKILVGSWEEDSVPLTKYTRL